MEMTAIKTTKKKTMVKTLTVTAFVVFSVQLGCKYSIYFPSLRILKNCTTFLNFEEMKRGFQIDDPLATVNLSKTTLQLRSPLKCAFLLYIFVHLFHLFPI